MKKLSLIICLCLVINLFGVSVAMANTQTVWDGFDANAVKNGTNNYWTSGLSVYTDSVYGSGLIAPEGSSTQTTYDPAFTQTTVSKREWNKLTAKNSVTSDDADSYELSFKIKCIEGTYATTFGGCYVYLRSDTLSNYLDNRFAIILRRNQNGNPQIGLKKANQGITGDDYLPIGVSGVTLLDTNIKVVDDFTTNTVKVYATDGNDMFQLIGTVSLNLQTKSATLTNAAGTTLTRTGYANEISGTSSKPMFILAENSMCLFDVKVKYPLFELTGAVADVTSGSFLQVPETGLSTEDEGADIFYTVDGSDPRTSDTRIEYTSGVVDFGDVGDEYPITLYLKAVTHLNGEYSEVSSYGYTIISPESTYPLDPEMFETSEDPYWHGLSPYVVTSFDGEEGVKDTITTPQINSWTYLTPKFTMPAVVETYEYKFTMKNLVNDGFRKSGIYIPIKAAELSNYMTDTQKAFVVIGPNGIGMRNTNNWVHYNSEFLPYGNGINVGNNTYTVRVFVTPDDTEETVKVYLDNTLVGTYSLDGDTFTLTNSAGDTITRDGIVTVEDNYIPGMSITFTNPLVKDLSVFYPAENKNADADKTELKELIEQAEALDGAECEPEEYAQLLYALKDAKEVYENAFVYQQEVDDATAALQSAVDSVSSYEYIYKSLFNEDFEETDTAELTDKGWNFVLPVNEFVSEGKLVTDGLNGRFAMTPWLYEGNVVTVRVKYGTAEAAAVLLRQTGLEQTYINSYRDTDEKYFGSEGMTLHIKAEGLAEDEICLAFPESEGTGYEKTVIKLPEGIDFADFENISFYDYGAYIDVYTAGSLLFTVVFNPETKESGAYTEAMILDASGNVAGVHEGIYIPESGRMIFASAEGTMELENILCMADINSAEITSIETTCTTLVVYGEGKLSTVAFYDNGVEAEVENAVYTSLTPEIASVDESGNVIAFKADTAEFKTEFGGVETVVEVEIMPLSLAVVLNETDEPSEITEQDEENYDKVFYSFENKTSVTVPVGTDGTADIWFRTKGNTSVSVKADGREAGTIDVNNEEFRNYKVTAELKKGLVKIEVQGETEIEGIWVQKIAGSLPQTVLTGITLSKDFYDFVIGDEGEEVPTVTAEYFDGETGTVNAEFTSRNNTIVTVEDGMLVPGNNDGTTVVDVTYTENGITKQAEINVSVTPGENIVIIPNESMVSAQANKTETNSDAEYAIDGNRDTLWSSGEAFSEGHEEDRGIYLSVELDGLHSAERLAVSTDGSASALAEKINGVWVDIRRMQEESLNPYENEGSWRFIGKDELTLVCDEVGNTVKVLFEEPVIVNFVAVEFDKNTQVSISEVKVYEDTLVPATETAETLTFNGEGIEDGKVTLTQGEELSVTISKNYPRIPSVQVETYVASSENEEIAWVENGVVKTNRVGECTVTTTVDGLTATLEVTASEMPAIICNNADAFINMTAGNEAQIVLSEGLYKIRFLSENTAVATVDAEGNVEAVGNGRTRVKIYSEVYGEPCVYISVNVGEESAETEFIISEDFEQSTSLPSTWSYFIWQGENKQTIETIEGENYLRVGNDWIGGAVHNTVITAEKYTVETNAGVTGPDGVIFIRLPEVVTPILDYTGETDYDSSGRRYGRDGVAFNLLGNKAFGITFRTKELDKNNYPKAVNINVPVPAEVCFPDGTFADFRFDDTGDNIYVSVGGQLVCRIVFTSVETDPENAERVLSSGYVEDASGKKLGSFNKVSLPGGNYRIGYGSRGKTMYVNDLVVTDNPMLVVSNEAEFKTAEVGDPSKKISVTQFSEEYMGNVVFESSDANVVTVDSQGNVSFAGRGNAGVYVYTEKGNMYIPVKVLGAEDVQEIVCRLAAAGSEDEAEALYEELSEEYGIDFSGITDSIISERFIEELGIDDAENLEKLSDIEDKIVFAEKVQKIAVAASATGSGDKLKAKVELYAEDLGIDLTEYNAIKNNNIKGKMWKNLFNELKTMHVNSAVVKDYVEEYASVYYAEYLESRSEGGSGGGGGGGSSGGGMIYTDATVEIPVSKVYYKDLPTSHWASKTIEGLTNMGVLSGYEDGTIRPDGQISREEAITVIIKAFIKKTSEGTVAEGDNSSEWAVPYLISAKEKGLIVGDANGYLNGKANATRSEIAVIISRLINETESENSAIKTYKDAEDIPSWAEGAFAVLNEKGIIKGYEDGTIRPGALITRAEFFTIIYRLMRL